MVPNGGQARCGRGDAAIPADSGRRNKSAGLGRGPMACEDVVRVGCLTPVLCDHSLRVRSVRVNPDAMGSRMTHEVWDGADRSA